ncbi:MAG: hypothetical protein ACON3Z_13665 [Bradymonadia bacterium]
MATVLVQLCLFAAIAIWAARFFISAEIRFPYLDSQKQETIEYSLWIPAERKIPTLSPAPQQISHNLCDLPGSRPVLFIDHGVEVHAALPLYLAGIDVDCLDVLAVPPASSLAASAEYLLRESTGGVRAARGSEPMNHTEHRCLWFQKHRSLAAELNHEVDCQPRDVAQSIKASFGGIDQRRGQTDDGLVLVQSLGHGHGILDRVVARHRLRPLMALLCFCEVVIAHIVPLLALFSLASRDFAYLALTLALLTRIALALNGRLKPIAIITEFLLRPYQLMRLAMHAFKALWATRTTCLDNQNRSVVASEYRVQSIGLAADGHLSSEFEWHVLKGQPLGCGGFATWIDQWILNRPAFRAYRWTNIELRRVLRTIRPNSSLVAGFSSLTAYPYELSRPWFADVGDVTLDGPMGYLSCNELQRFKLDSELQPRFDCVVFHGYADMLSDSDLRYQLRLFRQCLKTDGHLLITSTVEPGMPRELMRRLSWSPRLRSSSAVEEHLYSCGFRLAGARRDPSGIRVVSVATKK